ncbi:S-layer homology domain-containing protein [Paenibacillus lutrae]|nr:S-layer homology domain-containing protein [Paenibacillus lutrae]
MKERVLILFMTIVMVFTLVTPGLVPGAEAAGGTVTKSYTATADIMEFLLSSQEHPNVVYRPELVVTYETGPANNPPAGSFTIAEGAATSASTVNLSITGSDPDAGDSVTHMRFADSAANLSAASWLPFSNTATFSLAGGDGSKTIYMQVRDSNNAISANSSQTILLDQTAPTGALIINDGASWTKLLTVSTVTPLFNEGSGLLNGSPYSSGTTITQDEAYTLSVTDSAGNDAIVSFRIDTTLPIVVGVVNGKIYNSNKRIAFNEGTATLNGAAFVSGTEVSQDGAYTLVVTDAAGNVTTVTFTIDKTAPIVTGVTNGKSYKEQLTVSFNEGTATLNGAAYISGTEIDKDGVYTLVVRDAAGNAATINFEIDNVGPAVTGVTDGGVYKSVTPGFNEGTAKLNGTAYVSGTEIDQDGTYTLVVTDAAGNATTVKFEIDNVGPAVTGVTKGGVYKSVTPVFTEGTATLNGAAYISGTEITQDGTYTLVVTDAAGNAATVKFEIDNVGPAVTGVTEGGVYKSVTPVFTEGTAELNGAAYISGTEIDQDGTYTLVVTDAAGNATTVKFEIDNVGPAVTGVTEGGVYKSVTPVFTEGTAELNGAAYISGTEIDQDGAYTLVVTDAAGNATTIPFQIDATAPTGTVIIQAGAEWTNATDVTLTLTSSDGNNGSGIVEMRLSSDGSDWGSWEPAALTRAWSLAAGDGEKTVYIQFKDKVGNVSGTIDDVIKLDQTIPTGTIVINSGAATTSGKLVTLTLTSSDGTGSGVTEMRFSEDNLTWWDWENVLPTKNWNFTGSPGLKNLYVQLRDAAGNVSVANLASITYQESSAGSNAGSNTGSNSGTPGSSGSTDIAPNVDVVIRTGSKSENAAKVDVKMVEGKKVTTVFLEDAQLKEMLNESGNKPVITVTVRNNSDTVNWEMDAALLQSLENKHAIIQVYTENVVYTLPTDEISANKWRNQLGTDIPLKDMKIKVEVINLPKSAFVFKNSGDGQVLLVAPPVSFSIKGLYGNKEIELNQFDTFVERHLVIPAGIDPTRITTGVKLMSDGTIIHIPTKVVREGGRDYAILNSMTNSIYGLIYNKKTMSNVSKHWAGESINDLASRLVVNGADEQRFLPDSEITRAEFMAISIRALGLSSANKTFDFKDVEEEAWYHQAVQIGYSYGLVDGHKDGSFKPDEKITRQEAMVILSRAMRLVKLHKEIDDTKQQELVNNFADSEQLASWARQAAALTIEIGIFGGSNGELRPLQNITRAETAAIIQRFLQKAEFI